MMEKHNSYEGHGRGILLITIIFVFAISLERAHAFSFGVADLFNVYSLGNIISSHSDYEGTSGATGDVVFDNFSIGLKSGTGSEFSLLVGGTTHYSSGSIFNGGIEAGGEVNVSNAFIEGLISSGGAAMVTKSTLNGIRTFGNADISQTSVLGSVNSGGNVTGAEGTVTGSVNTAGMAMIADSMFVRGSLNEQTSFVPDPSIDHGAIRDALTDASSDFAGRAATSTFTADPDRLVFHGGSGENVFDVSASDLSTPSGLIEFIGPPDAMFILNISGTDLDIIGKGFRLLSGVWEGNIVYNAFEADTLNMAAIGLPGTMLAPFASTTFNNGVINGNLYIGNLIGNGQVNLLVDQPNVVPEPASIVLVGSGFLGLLLMRRRKKITLS